ncbi:MAG: glycosyltransferase, partial [Bacteroidales bacterium]|nr:glycosyltransferase [Bacteroidales bacterium]
MVYYLLIFSKAAKKSQKLSGEPANHIPVSIIICARDEAENLEKNLPLFLEQNYPEFEVIVVNDCSEDHSEDVLQRLSDKYPRLRVSTIKKDIKFTHGKKLALTIGIKAAKYDTLLLSDADCFPAGTDWIRYIIRNYSDNKEVVLGIGLYEKRKGLLNLLIRYEAAFIAMQYTGMARIRKPYMGVGRNLSYKKELFFRNRGFASHLALESGDDDLFISEVSNALNTAVETHPDSFTFSAPETSLRNWVLQKKRHLKTGKFYQQSVKSFLGTEYLSRALLIIAFVALLINPEFFLLVLIVYILNLFVKGIIYS